jgi:hypothetical protein
VKWQISLFTFSGKIIILGLYPRMTIGAPKSFTYWRDNIRFYIVTIFIIISSKFLKMAFPVDLIYEALKSKVFTNRADNFFLHVYVNSKIAYPINLDGINNLTFY